MKIPTLSMLFTFFVSCISLLGATETKGYLSQSDIDLFFQQGYILKTQAITGAELEQLKMDVSQTIDRAVAEIYQDKNHSLADQDQLFYINGSRVVYKHRPDESISIARINGCCGMEPNLLNTVRSEKMLHTYFELLGTKDLEHIISQIHPKLPGDGIAYPKHQDIQFRKNLDPNWEDILGNGSYAICIICLDHMSKDNGGLWIDINSYPRQDQEEDVMWLEAMPGDILFMHPLLYHGSGTNNSPTESRKTLLTGFCAFGANHRPYPGAMVNTHIHLEDDGSITITDAPWCEKTYNEPINGH